jgi:DNA-binding protein H-NS
VAKVPPSNNSLTDLASLEKLSFKQLAKLHDTIQAQISIKRDEVREQLRDELNEKARLLGIDPVDLLPTHKPRGGTRGEVKPKYRDTRDPTRTWSGRGRAPRWLQERLDAGERKDDYLIR